MCLDHDIREGVAFNRPLICLQALRKLSIRSRLSVSDVYVSVVRDIYAHLTLPNVAHCTVDVFKFDDFPALHSCLTSSRGASYPEIMVSSHKLKFRRREPTRTMSFDFNRRVFESSADTGTLLLTPPFFSAVQECCFMTAGTVSGEWFASLPTLPNLRGLVANVEVPYHNRNTHDVVRYLTDTRHTPAPCRRLEMLCLLVWGGYMTSFPAKLSAMLLSRREAGCPIRRVILGLWAAADGDLDAQLRKMEGLVDELVWFWNADTHWLWRMPSLLFSSSPTVHAGWAKTNVGWVDTDVEQADEDAEWADED